MPIKSMITDVNQRWHGRCARYRPAGEPFEPRRYEVALIPDDTTARRFVIEHHYSRSYPAARFRCGLYEGTGRLVGVAVFSHPMSQHTLTGVFLGEATAHVELGRFVLLDEVPGNAESWMLGRSFRLLRREGIRGVVSFSDPAPRRDADGGVIFAGHIGTIYQAHNARYLGRTRRRSLHLLPDGSVLSERSMSKIRARARGFAYSAARLEAYGAVALALDEDSSAWLDRWLPRLTRRLRHPGNHKYAWVLKGGRYKGSVRSVPYPKVNLFGLAQ